MSEPTPRTECCDAPMPEDQRYCPKCGWEARIREPASPLLPGLERAAEMPTIVCLCGSTRFKDAFDEAIYTETMAGKIVLSVGFYMHASGNKHGESVGATPEQKIALDELHKHKIDLCDEVLVLNVGGYIGESTRSEIDYAIAHNKPVRYLESAAEISRLKGTGE